MKNKIIDFINHNNNPDTIFVLKGFSLSEINLDETPLSRTLVNKLNRFIEINTKDTKVISFEEFMGLYDFIISQFQSIYIIENPIYYNYWPVLIPLDESIINKLISHFNIDEEDDIKLVGIEEYLNIFSNFLSIDDTLSCCYNDQAQLINEKIQRIILEKKSPLELEKLNNLEENQSYLNIYNDQDYFALVDKLEKTDESIGVTIDNFEYGRHLIQERIESLNGKYAGRLYLYEPKKEISEITIPPLVMEMMNKYWGFNTFRDIFIYDFERAKKKERVVTTVSQATIIHDIIEQVEYCINQKPYRDLFVTASTGAGKSLIFQLPAMYLAEKYNLVTLVITPLIGLMNDQVQALNKKGYTQAQTINSDISPILRKQILDDVANGKTHILYLSPESLLSRSDVQQLIGSRKIGMIVVDEAHIVTTWGKQFRPDYWYLGDHVQRIRQAQQKRDEDPSPFIIATFTATAIYQGKEDMYHETINSLRMIDPITYLGYIKRKNINIEISEKKEVKNKTEYELNKFDGLIEIFHLALMRKKKTLIYFPTVALINRFYDYVYSKGLYDYVTKYHGQLSAEEKTENFQAFHSGVKLVMLATKAFGMGIDIPDISIVSHYAPTGNVCDYLQEIGRAARDSQVNGQAIYEHMRNDFKHINRLHGLSAIQRYQLVEVIKKILDLYRETRYKRSKKTFTKKRNEMLIDTQTFAYIFDGPGVDEDGLINKVKTAMLLIQKDYEKRMGYSPFHMRPIPLFKYGYFSIPLVDQNMINKRYNNAVELLDYSQNVCKVDVNKIWEKDYSGRMSFPKFKFLLYTKSQELEFNSMYNLTPAIELQIFFNENYQRVFEIALSGLIYIINNAITNYTYLSINEMTDMVRNVTKFSRHQAENIIHVFLAAVNTYQKEYMNRLNNNVYRPRPSSNEVKYSFLPGAHEFISWLRDEYGNVLSKLENDHMYVVDFDGSLRCKKTLTALGLFEAFGVLRFKATGGDSSQIYIYVNETKTMQMVVDQPYRYRNSLLEMISDRHKESVKMLSYLFQNELSNDTIWEHLEDYFLGILPEELNQQETNSDNLNPDITLQFQIGEKLVEYYEDWSSANEMFDYPVLYEFDKLGIPLADYYEAKFIIQDTVIPISLTWTNEKIALLGNSEVPYSEMLSENGWKYYFIENIDLKSFSELFKD